MMHNSYLYKNQKISKQKRLDSASNVFLSILLVSVLLNL